MIPTSSENGPKMNLNGLQKHKFELQNTPRCSQAGTGDAQRALRGSSRPFEGLSGVPTATFPPDLRHNRGGVETLGPRREAIDKQAIPVNKKRCVAITTVSALGRSCDPSCDPPCVPPQIPVRAPVSFLACVFSVRALWIEDGEPLTLGGSDWAHSWMMGLFILGIHRVSVGLQAH